MGNSFLAKMYTYDPMNQLGVSKYVDPVATKLFGNYSKSSGPGTPGPYAGITPTLADANNGYVKAAAAASTPTPAAPAASQGATGMANSMNNLFGSAAQPPSAAASKTAVPPARQPVQPLFPGQQQQGNNLWGSTY
jgi:hypothetical protein